MPPRRTRSSSRATPTARSPAAARGYAGLADRLCRSAGVPVSFLLHPTDVLDRDDAPQLGFFPGMGVPWQRKRQLLVAVLRRFARERQIMTLAEAARTAPPATRR